MKLLFFLAALCLADARQDWRLGKIFYFGNNLQHSLLLGQGRTTYNYYPSITKIHTNKEIQQSLLAV